MHIGVPKETWPGETRVALVPQNAKKLVNLGLSVTLESGAGVAAGFLDAEYEEAGAVISSDRQQLLGSADIVMRVRKPDAGEVSSLKSGAINMSFLDPFNEKELVEVS